MNMIAMLLSWILSWKKLGPLNDFKYLCFQKFILAAVRRIGGCKHGSRVQVEHVNLVGP